MPSLRRGESAHALPQSVHSYKSSTHLLMKEQIKSLNKQNNLLRGRVAYLEQAIQRMMASKQKYKSKYKEFKAVNAQKVSSSKEYITHLTGFPQRTNTQQSIVRRMKQPNSSEYPMNGSNQTRVIKRKPNQKSQQQIQSVRTIHSELIKEEQPLDYKKMKETDNYGLIAYAQKQNGRILQNLHHISSQLQKISSLIYSNSHSHNLAILRLESTLHQNLNSLVQKLQQQKRQNILKKQQQRLREEQEKKKEDFQRQEIKNIRNKLQSSRSHSQDLRKQIWREQMKIVEEIGKELSQWKVEGLLQ